MGRSVVGPRFSQAPRYGMGWPSSTRSGSSSRTVLGLTPTEVFALATPKSPIDRGGRWQLQFVFAFPFVSLTPTRAQCGIKPHNQSWSPNHGNGGISALSRVVSHSKLKQLLLRTIEKVRIFRRCSLKATCHLSGSTAGIDVFLQATATAPTMPEVTTWVQRARLLLDCQARHCKGLHLLL
jgi:hypothetical protein